MDDDWADGERQTDKGRKEHKYGSLSLGRLVNWARISVFLFDDMFISSYSSLLNTPVLSRHLSIHVCSLVALLQENMQVEDIYLTKDQSQFINVDLSWLLTSSLTRHDNWQPRNSHLKQRHSNIDLTFRLSWQKIHRQPIALVHITVNAREKLVHYSSLHTLQWPTST